MTPPPFRTFPKIHPFWKGDASLRGCCLWGCQLWELMTLHNTKQSNKYTHTTCTIQTTQLISPYVFVVAIIVNITVIVTVMMKWLCGAVCIWQFPPTIPQFLQLTAVHNALPWYHWEASRSSLKAPIEHHSDTSYIHKLEKRKQFGSPSLTSHWLTGVSAGRRC